MPAIDCDGAAEVGPVRLRIAADLCPQILLRVLGVVSRQCAIPHSFAASRSPDALNLEISLDGLRDETLERIRAQMEAIVGVRTVS